MNKTQITDLAQSLVSQHLPNEWKFEWNRRKSALGLCNYTKKTIFLSEYFVGRISDYEIKDTILHEIAHALAGIRHSHRGHGWQWKKICREIGANPERLFDGEVKNQDFRYTVKCPSCGFKFGRHRFNKHKLNQLKNGHSWFPCKCKKSRMDVYDGRKKLVDGNSAKRAPVKKVTKTQAESMSTQDLINHMRKMTNKT